MRNVFSPAHRCSFPLSYPLRAGNQRNLATPPLSSDQVLVLEIPSEPPETRWFYTDRVGGFGKAKVASEGFIYDSSSAFGELIICPALNSLKRELALGTDAPPMDSICE